MHALLKRLCSMLKLVLAGVVSSLVVYAEMCTLFLTGTTAL